MEPSRVVPLRTAVRSFLRTVGLDAHVRDDRVFRAWSQALGPALAERAPAVRFREGDLTVEVQSAAHLQELASFTGEGFRKRANEHLGSETIRHVTFKLKAR